MSAGVPEIWDNGALAFGFHMALRSPSDEPSPGNDWLAGKHEKALAKAHALASAWAPKREEAGTVGRPRGAAKPPWKQTHPEQAKAIVLAWRLANKEYVKACDRARTASRSQESKDAKNAKLRERYRERKAQKVAA